MALIGALVALALAAPSAEGVVGGTPADAREWSHTVALLDPRVSDPSQAQFCAGTLIAPRWVVTAAHCLELDGAAVSAREVQVARGARLSALRPSARVGVAQVVPHPLRTLRGGPARGHDLALLRLSRPVGGATARLPATRSSFARGAGGMGAPAAWAELAGWGGADSRATRSDHLRAGRVSVLDPRECTDLGGAADTICATRPASREPAACPGDSGGPLMASPHGSPTALIGVVSTGAGHCLRGATAAFTDLRVHAGWMESVLGNDPGGTRSP